MREPRVAMLVLAHRYVVLLNRLIDALDYPGVDTFIHIDKKQGEEYRSQVKGRAVILPREDSYDIGWGTMEMVLATIRLMREASAYDGYTHFVCLSGQHYPSRPVSQLFDLFAGGDADFVSILPDNYRFISRYLLYYPHWMRGKKPWKKPFRVGYKGLGLLLPFLQRRDRPAAHFSCGSQWWAMRSEVVKWMLGEIDKNPNWIAYYKNSLIPDEGFFQTLYENSPWAGQNEGILTYIDWSAGGPSPEVLTERDYGAIVESDKYFARKMDSKKSSTLLNMLDKRICSMESGAADE